MFRIFRRQRFRKQHTAQEIYDDLIKSHGEHIAIIEIVSPRHIYLESFDGEERLLKQVLSGYDGELVETSIKGVFDLYL